MRCARGGIGPSRAAIKRPHSALLRPRCRSLCGNNLARVVVWMDVWRSFVALTACALCQCWSQSTAVPRAGPVAANAARNKLRTAPLWGPRMRPRFMHELRLLTLESAIERRYGGAEHVTREFRKPTEIQRQQLISYLESLLMASAKC